MGAMCAKRKIKQIPKGNIENSQSNQSESFSIREVMSNQSNFTTESSKQFKLKFPSSDCLYNLQQLSKKGHLIYKCNSMFQIKIDEQQVEKQLTEDQDYQHEAYQENSDSQGSYGMKKIQYFQNSFSFYSSEKGSQSVVSLSYY